MSDRFSLISAEKLLQWILDEEENKGQIFGIPRELFFTPAADDPFRMNRYGQLMETPIGVAAGPQTQMAQNLIAAWLTGGRYLELKTVQTLDELEISKPCIDMEDAGYNCEWSQELRLKESYREYLNAWIIMHILKHKFGWGEADQRGFLFNMSVGYNLEGILKENVQWFLDKMADCSAEKEETVAALAKIYPAVKDLDIPDMMSDNITLSTMHGCPPDEIEKIGLYLIEKRKYNTTIKLNPTLVGPEMLRGILNDKLGFETNVPDEAFGHDLKYPDALSIIRNLTDSAAKNNVAFGLKLTNTLESVNHRDVFPENEEMMYMSGRALHPISINLAAKLQTEFDGKLDISFSAGADAFNVEHIIASGIKPITVSSDLLKPGGYGRFAQYLDNLKQAIKAAGAEDIDGFITARGGDSDTAKAALTNLQKYAAEVADNKQYSKSNHPQKLIKTERELTPFDCVKAPCINTCPSNQEIPEYMYYTAQGDFDKAFETILKTNPFPTITGMVCDHLCMTKCTRLNYDDPLRIRDIKRFVVEKTSGKADLTAAAANGIKVAVIGGGPAGLSCAYFLALEGFSVDVYESKPFGGGMTADAIPSFRLTDEQIQQDIKRIEALGVKIHYDAQIDESKFIELRQNNDFVFIGVGAQKNRMMGIAGEADSNRVMGGLQFLSKVRRGDKVDLGKRVAVIGGGNSAMDAARVAYRLSGADGKVTILYRRTIAQMPADREELDAVQEEGVEILELTNPSAVKEGESGVTLVCDKMKLGEPDDSGRRRPVATGEQVELEFDLVIPAIGQQIVLDFLKPEELEADPVTCETKIENVYIGGDALHGPLNIITAIADGKKAASNIMKKSAKTHRFEMDSSNKGMKLADYQQRSATRQFAELPAESSLDDRRNFKLVIQSLSDEQAQKEAERCLYCNDICNVCVTVCPNRANVSYTVPQTELSLQKAGKDGKITADRTFRVEQQYQTLNVSDFCNECGNCETFCPTSGAPYRDKPKFCLTDSCYGVQPNGYKLLVGEEQGIKFRNGDGSSEHKLLVQGSDFSYTAPGVEALLDGKTLQIKDVKISGADGLELGKAAEMFVLYGALKESQLAAASE